MSTSATSEARPRAAAPAPAQGTDHAPEPMSHKQVLETLSGLLLGMFVAILSSTVVSNALPIIVPELNGNESTYTWVVTASLLATTISTPIWGKLADLFSKKLLVQTALVIFAVSSIVAGLSQNMGMLITTRVFQGVGAGGLTALSQVILATIVSPRERGRYSGYLGATFALGTVGGPLIGGALTEHFSWRWCFYVGIPFAILALIVLQKTLHVPTVKREVHIDYLGATLLAAGVSSLLIWVSLAGHDFDWWSWQTALMVGGGIVLLALTVLAEKQAPEPILPLRLFRNMTTVLSSVASLFVGVAMFGATVFLSQYFQLARGESPTMAGVMTIPMITGLFLSSTISGLVITRTGKWKTWLVVGGVLLTAGLGLMSTIAYDSEYWITAIYMFLLGAGVGMMMQNLVLAVQNVVDPRDLGAASSLVAFTRSMGGAIGVSALGAVLGHRVKDYLADGLTAAHIKPTGMGASEGIPNLAQIPEPVRSIVQSAYGEGIADVFMFAAPFAAIAFVITLFLKETLLRSGAAGAPAAAPAAAAAPVASAASHDAGARTGGATAVSSAAAVRSAHEAAGEVVGATDGAPAGSSDLESEHVDQRWNAPTDHRPRGLRTPAGLGAYGLVTKGGYAPLADAHITLADQAGQQIDRTRSDDDGYYRLRVEHPGSYLLIVAADNLTPDANLVQIGNRALRHDVALSGMSAVTGRVLRHDRVAGGELPVGDALLTLTDPDGHVVASTRSTADGSYALEGLMAGQYILTAQGQRHRPQARMVQVADSGASVCDLAFDGGGHLAGTVIAARDGRMLPDSVVTLVGRDGQVVASTVTGPDGRYAFEDIEAGDYTLTASGFAPVSVDVTVQRDAIGTHDIALGARHARQGGDAADMTGGHAAVPTGEQGQGSYPTR